MPRVNTARLRSLRLQKGLTQEQLAERIGYMNQSSYALVELGKRRVPAGKLLLLADVLEVPMDSLLVRG